MLSTLRRISKRELVPGGLAHQIGKSVKYDCLHFTDDTGKQKDGVTCLGIDSRFFQSSADTSTERGTKLGKESTITTEEWELTN